MNKFFTLLFATLATCLSAQQMNNNQQGHNKMNLQFAQNEIMNNFNQIPNNNQSQFYQFQQQQLNQNFNLINNSGMNNMNRNQNMNISNNNPTQNINNMNHIQINFDDLNENFLNQNQHQIPKEMNMNTNINLNSININDKNNVKSKKEEEEQIEDIKEDNNNNKNKDNKHNDSIQIPKTNNKEETQITPNKKLENKFSFLYRIDDNMQYQSQRPVMEKEKYESQVKKIAEFDTIEEFWGIFQHLRKPDSCRPGIEYFMFKEPIKPMWEDENNKNGGRFSIKLKHGYTTIIWEEMIFALIGGILPKEIKEEINGIVVTSRKDFNTLQIWFKNYDDKITEDLEQCIRDLLVIPNEVKIEKRQFNKKDYGNNNSSNNNKNNNNNNKSVGYHNKGYNNNNNYDNGGHGNYYKDHKKGKHQSNRNK